MHEQPLLADPVHVVTIDLNIVHGLNKNIWCRFSLCIAATPMQSSICKDQSCRQPALAQKIPRREFQRHQAFFPRCDFHR